MRAKSSVRQQENKQFLIIFVSTFVPQQTREGAVAIPETVTEGIYDYAENVESGSTLSTPTSSHTGEPPFASEGLGDTVIHLDKVGLNL